MIQSVKFDSSYMDIKRITDYTLNFTIKRLLEITGVCVSVLGILLLISLISYSPNDPNFIFPKNTEIKKVGWISNYKTSKAEKTLDKKRGFLNIFHNKN